MDIRQHGKARALALPFPPPSTTTSCLFGAPEISPATRFTFDKWRPGHAGPGRGWGAPHPQIPSNPPHPQMRRFRQRYLSIHHTALHPQIHCFRQRYLFLLNTIQSGPGQQFTASYNNAPALVHNSPAKQGNGTGLF